MEDDLVQRLAGHHEGGIKGLGRQLDKIIEDLKGLKESNLDLKKSVEETNEKIEYLEMTIKNMNGDAEMSTMSSISSKARALTIPKFEFLTFMIAVAMFASCANYNNTSGVSTKIQFIGITKQKLSTICHAILPYINEDRIPKISDRIWSQVIIDLKYSKGEQYYLVSCTTGVIENTFENLAGPISKAYTDVLRYLRKCSYLFTHDEEIIIRHLNLNVTNEKCMYTDPMDVVNNRIRLDMGDPSKVLEAAKIKRLAKCLCDTTPMDDIAEVVRKVKEIVDDKKV